MTTEFDNDTDPFVDSPSQEEGTSADVTINTYPPTPSSPSSDDGTEAFPAPGEIAIPKRAHSYRSDFDGSLGPPIGSLNRDESKALLGPGLPTARSRARSSSLNAVRNLNDKFGQLRREIQSKYEQIRHRTRFAPPRATEIYYTVFKPGDHGGSFSMPPEGLLSKGPTSQAQFNQIVDDAMVAIESGKLPRRIAQGSSGSYFVAGPSGEIVGVFKPKDEEPYGPLSPKWTKWLHRNLFPCFFGRSCLIPNNGYICEAAASLLDRLLQTYIVPFTDVVSLSSPSFYYAYFDRRRYRRKGIALPSKVGSFQLFLHGYMQANSFLQKYPLPESDGGWNSRSRSNNDRNVFRWTPEVLQQFREEVEKLVVLDYIMRNTDRGLDNWMIHVEWVDGPDGPGGRKIPKLKIGAIDSGLAFPWKHPDEWRSYPFGWLFLPVSIIGQPFSQKTRDHFIPLLTSSKWWEESSIAFRELFSRDTEFKERMWRKQWAVLKGQAFNVVESMKNPDEGPLELARRTRVMIWDDEMEIPVRTVAPIVMRAMETPMSRHRDEEEEIESTGSDTLRRNDSQSTQLSSFPILQTPEDGRSPPRKSPRAKNRNRGGSLSLEARYRALQEEGRLQNKPADGNNNSNVITRGRGASLWTELINEDLDPQSIDAESHALRTIITSNDVGFSYAEDASHTGYKAVIVERLQTVKTKPPVFTWW